MTRFRQLDILVELIELCKERAVQVRQQLGYYRASVYKHEMAETIKAQLEDLRLVSTLLSDDMVMEPFRDYDMRTLVVTANCEPGECSFSHRVTILLTEFDYQLLKLSQGLSSRSFDPETEPEFDAMVKSKRSHIVALCRLGSRQRYFFEAL